MTDTLTTALLIGALLIAWLCIALGLIFGGLDQSAETTSLRDKARGMLFAFVGAMILVVPLVYYAVMPRTSTLLDPGCYHVDVQSTTTYVLSGKVLVPVVSYRNTFTQFVCPN